MDKLKVEFFHFHQISHYSSIDFMWMPIVCQVVVISVNINGVRCRQTNVSPGFEGIDYRHILSSIDVIAPFGRCQGVRDHCNNPPFLLIIPLVKNCSYCVLGCIYLDLEGSAIIRPIEYRVRFYYSQEIVQTLCAFRGPKELLSPFE